MQKPIKTVFLLNLIMLSKSSTKLNRNIKHDRWAC